MKTFSILFLLVAVIASYEVTAQNVNVKCTVSLNGEYQPDSLFIGLFPTHENYFLTSGNPPNPALFERVVENALEFEAEPGIYLIGCCAWKYAHAYRLIYLEPNKKQVQIHFNMQPLPLGYGHKMDKIEKVGIKGEFNQFNTTVMPQLVEDNGIWKLQEKPAGLMPGQMYLFVVNDEETEDLLNDSIFLDKYWLNFKNIYSGNELVFDPSLYGVQENPSLVEIQNPSLMNEQLMSLSAELSSFDKSQEEFFAGLRASKEVNHDALYDDLNNRLAKIESDYNADFSQLFLEKRLELQLLNWYLMNASLTRNNSNEEQYKEFFNGEEFGGYFSENIKLLNELEAESYLLKGDFFQNVLLMANISESQPELLSKNNLSSEYFSDFLESFIDKTRSERLCCNLIFNQAAFEAYKNEDKANELLNRLKQHDYESYIPLGRYAALNAMLNIKIGKQAPEFDVKTVEGDIIRLLDYKGRFVFLDFWGSWCGPCIKELPHIKKLHSMVSRDKLEVIGLAQDKEESLIKCIAENEIKYPNALAGNSLLLQFGIRQFPTSFLINPDGKIVRMNMRGEDELLLIAEEINHYYK